MIDGIADEVGERIFDRLDDGLVEFGLLALHLNVDLFPTRRGQVAHHPGELAPDVSDGLHARLHDAFLQFGGDEVQPLGGVQEARILLRRGELQDLVPGQYKFSHQVHQLIQQAHIDTNVAVGKGRGACFRLDLQSVLHGGGLGGTLFHKDFAEAAVVPFVLELQSLVDFLSD